MSLWIYIQYCAKVFKCLSNGEAPDWLQICCVAGQRPQTCSQPVIRKCNYSVKKNKQSWKWWCSPHTALISASSSVSGITWRDGRMWARLHPQKMCGWLSEMCGSAFLPTSLKNCVRWEELVHQILTGFLFLSITLYFLLIDAQKKTKLLTLLFWKHFYFTAFFSHLPQTLAHYCTWNNSERSGIVFSLERQLKMKEKQRENLRQEKQMKKKNTAEGFFSFSINP